MVSRIELDYNIALDQDEVEEAAYQQVGGSGCAVRLDP
jgi:hypothetical protein